MEQDTRTSYGNEDQVALERDSILNDLITLAVSDDLPSAVTHVRGIEQIQARRAAAGFVAQALMGLRRGVVPPEWADRDARYKGHAASEMEPVLPARCVGKPLVVVKRTGHCIIVTFTAQLARAYRVHQFMFAHVLSDPARARSEFRFTNDPAHRGGVFTLGFNGGSSKRVGSPGRVVQLPFDSIPLPDGSYAPRARWEREQLVIGIERQDVEATCVAAE